MSCVVKFSNFSMKGVCHLYKYTWLPDSFMMLEPTCQVKIFNNFVAFPPQTVGIVFTLSRCVLITNDYIVDLLHDVNI